MECETQKWILSCLITAISWSGGGVCAKFIKIDETSIYNKLVSKISKDKD